MDRAHTVHKFFSGWTWNPICAAAASFLSAPRNPIWPFPPVPPSTSSITCPLPPLTSSPPAHSRSPIHHVSLHITLFSLITHTTIQPCISVKYRNGSLVQQYMHTFFSKVTSMFATTIFYTQPLQQNWLWSQVPSPTNHLYHNFVVAILNRCHGLPRILVPKKRLPHWTCIVIR